MEQGGKVLRTTLAADYGARSRVLANAGVLRVPAFIHKTRDVIKRAVRAIITWIQAVALLPLVALVVALRPFVLIRFGVMDASRIGHLCNTEGYLCLRDVESSRRRVLDFIGCSTTVCNRQLHAMFARTLSMFPWAGLLRGLARSCQVWTRSDVHCLEFGPRDLQWLEAVEPHLHFTEEEHKQGRRLLERLGIPSGAGWVCIHNRDCVYLDRTQAGRDWSYHDFRDFSVQSMQPAAEELARRGYYVLRMGSSAEHPLVANHSRVIDYANHAERSDFGDIYLLGNCRFYVGSESGIFAVSTLFRRPFAFVNFPVPQPCYDLYHWNPMPFILKRARHKKGGRLLSLRELFALGLASAYTTEAFEAAGVELVCNTPDEICDLATEVDDRCHGRWQSKPDDEELQKKFWEIFHQHNPHARNVVKARIGAAFLRKHADLLK
ncbi:MAG: TIGR04372 family glycosyltransferase [Nitrospiraceae bacterium]